MAARASRNYMRDFLFRNAKIGAFGGGGGSLGAVRHSSSVPKNLPKIPQPSKKGGILTAAFLGIAISGGAYVGTLDEATSCGWLFSATKFVNPIFAFAEKRVDPPELGLEVWGRRISTPVGLSAGFNKNVAAVEGLLGMGFGFVEIDEVPQRGKAGPGVLGVNFGKNKTSEGKTSEVAAADHVQGVHTLSQCADYLVVNVSSPNTPGSRKLQGREQLAEFIEKVQAAREQRQWGEEGPPPLLVKIAPDLSKLDLEDIAAVALTLRLDGLIVTTSSPDPACKNPFDLSLNVLTDIYPLTRGKVPLIGCAVISNGEDVDKKIQLYSAFAFIPQKKVELAQCLGTDGCKSTDEVTDADYKRRAHDMLPHELTHEQLFCRNRHRCNCPCGSKSQRPCGGSECFFGD